MKASARYIRQMRHGYFGQVFQSLSTEPCPLYFRATEKNLFSMTGVLNHKKNI